jgi:uncharacterized membrane protein YgcG
MPKTTRTSGNWGEKQKSDMRKLIGANKVDYTRQGATYLWEICQLEPFKPFISAAASGKNSAVQRMQRKFLRHEAELEQKGARKKGMCPFFPQSTSFLTHTSCSSPDLTVETPTQPMGEIPQAEEGTLKSPVGVTAKNDVQLTDMLLASYFSNVHLANELQPYFFDEEFKYLHYTTPFFDNGHKRAIYDFLVTGQHCDYFLMTINANMTSFTMKTCISPIFLNIMMRAAGELDRAHPNTNDILSGMRETTNILVLEVGGDFELVCSKGNVYPLPFECFPNAHRQLLWHQGCNKLINERRLSRNVDPQTFHQQTAILRVTFIGVAKQQMGSLHAEDFVIQTPHCSSFLSAGIALPGQPSAFSGGGGGGSSSGGFGGGFGRSFGGGGGGLVGKTIRNSAEFRD